MGLLTRASKYEVIKIDDVMDTFDSKVNIASPIFTGTPKVPSKITAATNDGTLIATEAQVYLKANTSHTHTISNITSLQTTLDSKAIKSVTTYQLMTLLRSIQISTSRNYDFDVDIDITVNSIGQIQTGGYVYYLPNNGLTFYVYDGTNLDLSVNYDALRSYSVIAMSNSYRRIVTLKDYVVIAYSHKSASGDNDDNPYFYCFDRGCKNLIRTSEHEMSGTGSIRAIYKIHNTGTNQFLMEFNYSNGNRYGVYYNAVTGSITEAGQLG
jgi:hypothetical protein